MSQTLVMNCSYELKNANIMVTDYIISSVAFGSRRGACYHL